LPRVVQDAICEARNGPGIDDRITRWVEGREVQNCASCGLREPFYDISTTYTKTQQLTEDGLRGSVGFLAVCCLSAHGIRFPMRLLRRVEYNFGGWIRRPPTELCRRLPGLL